MKTLRLAALFLILFYGLKFTLSLNEKPSHEYVDTESTVAPEKKKFRSADKRRAPASVEKFQSSPGIDSTYTASNKNDSLFKGFDAGDTEVAPTREDDQILNGGYASSSNAPARRMNDNAPSSPGRSPAKAGANAPKSVMFTGPQAFIPGVAKNTPAPNSSPTSDSSGVPSTVSNFNCSASIGAGTYSNPINVALNCSTSATVRYCLAEGTCCDPSTGLAYASPVAVGAEAKTYCLSYVGEDSTGQSTAVYEHSYTFNPATPNIQVSADKIVYQTTQLEGKSSFTSTDFGTADLAAGVLNLKGIDPMTASCDDMINNRTLFPSPYVVMPATSVSSLTPSQQVDVTLPKSTMDYGDNYFVSYLSHTLFSGVYGCSVKKITLEDFPYFDESPSNGVLNGSVLEFSGGFVAAGFFETPTDVYRGPASGSSTENISGQELRSGLMSIFH